MKTNQINKELRKTSRRAIFIVELIVVAVMIGFSQAPIQNMPGMQKETGKLLAPVNAPIVLNGQQVGSATLPAGTMVNILQHNGDKLLVSNGTESAWVAASAVAITVKPTAPTPQATTLITNSKAVQAATPPAPRNKVLLVMSEYRNGMVRNALEQEHFEITEDRKELKNIENYDILIAEIGCKGIDPAIQAGKVVVIEGFRKDTEKWVSTSTSIPKFTELQNKQYINRKGRIITFCHYAALVGNHAEPRFTQKQNDEFTKYELIPEIQMALQIK